MLQERHRLRTGFPNPAWTTVQALAFLTRNERFLPQSLRREMHLTHLAIGHFDKRHPFVSALLKMMYADALHVTTPFVCAVAVRR